MISTRTTLIATKKTIEGILLKHIKFSLAKEVNSDQLFQKATTAELKGLSLKLYKKSSRLELRNHSFSQRIVDHWNKLPDDVYYPQHIPFLLSKGGYIWMDRYGH